MFSLPDIVRRDLATYYEREPGTRVSRTGTFAVFIVVAFLFGFLVRQASNDFLAGALSAEAILVGFSFNVLFYLVANRLSKPVEYSGIAHELRFERLSRLSDEVFDNITYFNLVAIASAMMSLVLLLAGSDQFVENVHYMASHIKKYYSLDGRVLYWAKAIIQTTSLATLIFLLEESLYTFLRTVSRVRFYFTMLKTMESDNQSG